MTVKTKFDIGDMVYLRTDTEQLERLVTGIKVAPHGLVYTLAQGITETFHFELELSKERNHFKILGIN